ncbi:MAG: sulfotransferase [Chloroflexota bacterium]|nr:sulfotransferase [Chloroflexota bacterium]
MIHSPVLILGCPRSGTTLLYSMLSEISSLWSLGYESKAIIEQHHHPDQKDWQSGVLVASDLTDVSRIQMLDAFERYAAPGSFWSQINRVRSGLRGNPAWRWVKGRGRTKKAGSGVSSAVPQQGLNAVRTAARLRTTITGRQSTAIRLLEKTPENCLRLPFLLALFPDASVIYLTRDGRSNINSLIEGWQQPHLFPGYQVPVELSIPGYSRPRWAFTLIPGWQELTSSPLEEICAWQWVRCNEAVLEHRSQTGAAVPYLTIRYEDLIGNPGPVLRQIAQFLHIDYERDLARFSSDLPQINVVSSPAQDKWRRQNRDAIERVRPLIAPMMHQLGYDSKF